MAAASNPHPGNKVPLPHPSPFWPAAHLPSPTLLEATEWVGKLGGAMGVSTASWSALGWSPVSNKGSNYLGLAG